MKRVGCYVRVSTENQLENYSIEEQIERLKAYCTAKDWAVYKFYTDGGYSGGNTNRPALQQLLVDIESKNLDIVVVYKLDRLSRSQKDTLTLIEDVFLANGIDFVSMSENFDTSTPFGRAMVGILSVFAQLEKDQITERFTMGRIGRARNGNFHGGPTPPTGYDYIDSKLVINEYEALQVKEVFRLFLEGQSINSIRKYMSSKYTNKYGNWASHTLVLNVLRNSVYIGKVKFSGQEYAGNHTPIIDINTFEATQKFLQSPEREDSKTIFQKNPFRANNLLTSLIYCKRCGARFCGNHGNYVCHSRGKTDSKMIKDPNCKNKKWPIGELDEFVQNEILKLAYNEEYFNEKVKGKALPVKSDKAILLNRVTEIDKQISRMMDLYQVGGIPLSEITDRIAKLKDEKDSLAEDLADKEDKRLTITKAKALLSNAEEVFTTGDIAKKRLYISSLVDYIEVDGEFLDIHFSF
ncbi:site-specific DNA recombinase [Ruminiclostridium sufflavum DSM 19573]|uniref:Site-specific DNA recombinase n=1 Tax=Ruminiclostridium sufflavum DSM 19573 TaxID=1121337 RepID=A0A318XRA1_9FIRM|nr:recombinase family protein [Ruminiclostridium sufflavum]PYG90169.1 site-specific DNA recombinase [Ruminiclostridium sufflavum DSM 19573]